MKVSIIVPIYNTAETILRQCLDSLIAQTLSEIEILLIDDGSGISCATLCDEYAYNHSCVRTMHTPNNGVSAARNTGITLAQGDYLMFVDADDWLDVDTAARYYAYAQAHQLDILLSGCTIVNQKQTMASHVAKDQLFTPQTKAELQRTILDNNPKYLRMWPMSPWAKLFRTEFIHAHQLSFLLGLKRMQDNLFCIQALEHTNRVGYFAYTGYFYRQSSSSACHKFNPDYRQIFETALMHFKHFAENSVTPSLAINAYYVKGIIVLITEYPQLYYFHPENTKSWRRLCREYKHLCQSDPYLEIINQVRIMDCHRAYRIFCFVLKRGWYHFLWLLLYLQKKKAQLH